jgi:pterin-4a-carbinolamine dehydratase
LETVTATSAASIKPDAAALKKYGFDKPSAVIKFTVNGKSYKLTAGAKNGANRYVMLEGTDVIYITTNASVDAWADASYFTLRSKFVLLPLITDVSGMTVTSGSEVNTFAIARTKDEKKSTEDTPAYTYTVTGNNGKKLTYDKNFKNYYQTVISATLLEDYSKKPSGTPAATIEYKYFDGSKHIVQFYNAADRRFAAVVDGIVCGLVKSTDVDTIISNTKLMENDTLVSVE